MGIEALDDRWDGQGGQILVEIKRTASVRDVRAVLLSLAYAMKEEPLRNQAVCVITDTKLSFTRLRDELKQFREVMHPEIAPRIHFLIDQGEHLVGSNRFAGSLLDVSVEFFGWLALHMAKSSHSHSSHQLSARQTVRVAMAQLRLRNAPPVTVKYLQSLCKVSYPTVSETLKEFAASGLLLDEGDRGVSLRHLSMAEWMDLARDHAKQRKSFSFVDATGFATPQQLANRIHELKVAGILREPVRIGGVMGAAHHFPQVDITAASRLDLSVDADPTQIAALIDAGLKPKVRSDQKAVLVLHVTHEPTLDSTESPNPWANELECLADLIEMSYTREATEMAHFVEVENKKGTRTI
jgi:hypothetical protein